MNTKYYKNQIYLSAGLKQENSVVKAFFERVFVSFERELKHLEAFIYPDSPEQVFNNIERSWVGIFDNAVRYTYADKVATLQEFSVALSDKCYGRADYFVRLIEENTDLLFEAKQYEDLGGNNYTGMNDWYSKILKKADGYYQSEQHSYKYYDDTYLVALIFGWIRKENVLKNAMAEMEYLLAGNKPKDNADFAALFSSGGHGVWVYGKAIKAETGK